MKRLLALVLLSVALLTAAQENQLVDEEPLILELTMDRYLLHDSLIAFPRDGKLLVPLGAISHSLDFAIDVQPAKGVARGWFIEPHRSFELDLTKGEVRVNNSLHHIAPGQFQQEFDDLYIDSELLSQWFPLDFQLQLSRLQLQVSAREVLPFQAQLQRQQQGDQLGRGQRRRKEYPLVQQQYRWASWPVLDLGLDGRVDDRESWRGDYDLLLAGDLAKLSTRLFLNGSVNDGGLASSRLTLGRRHPSNTGVLGSTEFALGDIFTPELSGLADSEEGRGAMISNYDLNSSSEFDRTTLRGELLQGWQVELYVNDQLLGFQGAGSRADGLYEFTDVPLIYGGNQIKLVFYGPQGQRREQIQTLYVGTDQLKSGQFRYRLGANEQGKELLGLDDRSSQPLPGEGEFRASGQLEYGLGRSLALSLGYATLAEEQRRHLYSLGLTSNLLGSYNRLMWLGDDEGNQGLEFDLQARWWQVNLSLEHLESWDLVTDRLSYAGLPLRRHSRVRLDTTLEASWLPGTYFSLEVERDQLRQPLGEGLAATRYGANQRTSFSGGWLQLTNTLRLERSFDEVSYLNGDLVLNRRFGDWSLRAGMDYGLGRNSGVDRYRLEGDWYLSQRFNFGVDLQHDSQSDMTSYGLSINREFKHFEAGLDALGNEEGDYELGLSFSIGLGHSSETGHFYSRPRGLASNGAAEIRAFLDNNGNNRFDEEDTPLPGVRFSGARAGVTGEDGVVLINGLYEGNASHISLDAASVADPYWHPRQQGVGVLGVSGHIETIDFPFVATGDIDGDVWLLQQEGEQPIGGARLQLVNEQGLVVKEHTSAYDGFFLMDQVPVGEYQLRLDPSQIEALNLAPVPPTKVKIVQAGDAVMGLKILLRSL